MIGLQFFLQQTSSNVHLSIYQYEQSSTLVSSFLYSRLNRIELINWAFQEVNFFQDFHQDVDYGSRTEVVSKGIMPKTVFFFFFGGLLMHN